MRPATRRWIQVFLAAALLLSAARVLWIFYQRRRPVTPPPKGAVLPARKVHPDYWVHLPRAYLTDFASAHKMKGATLWMRDGWRYAHYPFDAVARRTREIRFADYTDRKPPLLPPIQRIIVRDVTREKVAPDAMDEVNIIFELPGASPPLRSVTIGHCGRESCRFYVDDMFFLKDPRALYSHWPPEIWQSIERGEVRTGMSETQISFALGYPIPLPKESASYSGDRVVEFRPPKRPPVRVIFADDGNARRIEDPGTQAPPH